MDEVTFCKIKNLEDSLVLLQKQVERLTVLHSEDEHASFGGVPVKMQIVASCKALLYDAVKLQDTRGACEWSEAKRKFAIETIKKFT